MFRSIRVKGLRRLLTALLLMGAAAMGSIAQAQPQKTIKFAGTSYQLVWQSHPTPGYDKYEYLPKGEKLPYYRNMLMLDTLITDQPLKEVMRAKIDFIKQRKAQGDPAANYRILQNEAGTEYLLDFMLSANDEAVGAIHEWNVYRYTPYTNAKGEKGMKIFAYSARGYLDADDWADFAQKLPKYRLAMIQAMASATVPKVGGR